MKTPPTRSKKEAYWTGKAGRFFKAQEAQAERKGERSEFCAWFKREWGASIANARNTAKQKGERPQQQAAA